LTCFVKKNTQTLTYVYVTTTGIQCVTQNII